MVLRTIINDIDIKSQQEIFDFVLTANVELTI